MSEVISFLNENPVQYFATIGLDGKPKVRPFQFMLEENGRIYFSTSNQKDVFKELEACPHVEISVSSPQFAWIRLSGKVVFTSDMNVKSTVIESSELLQRKLLYKRITQKNAPIELIGAFLHVLMI